MTIIRNDLSDSEWRAFKMIYQKIANIYFEDNNNDEWHNMFLEVFEDIANIRKKGGWWPILYNKLKQIKGECV